MRVHELLLLERTGIEWERNAGGDGARTGGEAVTTGVALQLLFAVLAVKVIFAGRAQVHWTRTEQGNKTKMRNKLSRISSFLLLH